MIKHDANKNEMSILVDEEMNIKRVESTESYATSIQFVILHLHHLRVILSNSKIVRWKREIRFGGNRKISINKISNIERSKVGFVYKPIECCNLFGRLPAFLDWQSKFVHVDTSPDASVFHSNELAWLNSSTS